MEMEMSVDRIRSRKIYTLRSARSASYRLSFRSVVSRNVDHISGL